MSNYTLFDFSLDNPTGLGNAVTGAYVALAAIIFALSFLCCCTCKCFRSAMVSVVKSIFKLIWKLLTWLSGLLWEAVKKWRLKSKMPTLEENSSDVSYKKSEITE
jgi:hypothetical protein